VPRPGSAGTASGRVSARQAAKKIKRASPHGRREGVGRLSPEAAAAAAAFAAVRPGLADELAGSASGRELTDAGFAADVAIAAEGGAADVVPVLRSGVFTTG